MVNRKATLGVLILGGLGVPATALSLSLHTPAGAAPTKVRRMPRAITSVGMPAIGPLYASADATQHSCTASVVHSPRGDTLITAAHCIAGSGAGMVFVPGQRGAQEPYGRWTTTGAYVEPEWVTRQDPDADVAFLTVAPRTINGVSKEIEQVAGGYALGSVARSGQHVTVTGYAAGGANSAITCATKVYLTQGFPSFDCRGFVGGTSGAPWLRVTPQGPEIVGVIGGLDQGGCYDYTSYSARLARHAHTAYRRAVEDGPGDVASEPGGDGC